MATLNITLPEGASICNGKQVTFRAPCDCTGVTGIIIGGVTYALLTTNGETVDNGNAFISGALVSVLIDTENNNAYLQSTPGGLDIVELTYDEYQALETKDPDTMYVITDKTVSVVGDAEFVNYDNSTSGLAATNAQAAIDELTSKAAMLDETGKVSAEQLPEISAVDVYAATIGTTWTENSDTGVKTQNVAISGVTAAMTAKVDHAYTGDESSDSYATFVEAENQYLTYITNGYAETYDGGIKFTIFGDPNTVEIPIVVEVV